MILRSSKFNEGESGTAVSDTTPVPGRFLPGIRGALASASLRLLRELIRGFAQRMMDAEGSGCGPGRDGTREEGPRQRRGEAAAHGLRR